MNPEVYNAFIWGWIALGWADIVVRWRASYHDYVEWSYWFELTYCVTSIVLAAAALWIEPWTCAAFLVCAGISGWKWWHNDHNKRKRKQLADKAAGVVRDVGGRLKVVRPSTSGAR